MLTREQLFELICANILSGKMAIRIYWRSYWRVWWSRSAGNISGKTPRQGTNATDFARGHSYGHGRTLTFRIPCNCYGNFHPHILAILRHQEDESIALPERFTRKVLHRNRSARYSRISMASATAKRAFRGCWTTFARMSRNGSRALWRLITQSSSSIAYTWRSTASEA